MPPIEYLALFSDSIIYLSILFIPFYLWGNDRKKLLLYVICISINLGVVYFLKTIIAVPRPPFALISIPSTPSFPSMHASLGMLPAGFFFYNRKYRVLLLIYGILIAYSRVLLGVHYWIDIVVGASIGFVVPILIFYRKEKIYRVFGLSKHLKKK
ncbi:MAG: phosphatase PAP2 family protein [Candidatus Aenigmarchaeota archaeon]|nr:phosphatase PAP2 family protein [Candidatus Aenigmarchaeota archaeon]